MRSYTIDFTKYFCGHAPMRLTTFTILGWKFSSPTTEAVSPLRGRKGKEEGNGFHVHVRRDGWEHGNIVIPM